MANLNSTTAPVINLFTRAVLAQRFIDDPALFALAIEEGCSDMNDAEIAAMDVYVEWRTELARA